MSNLGYMRTESGWKKIESSNEIGANKKSNDYDDNFAVDFDFEDCEKAINAAIVDRPKISRRRREESYLQRAERESIRTLIIIAICFSVLFLILFTVVLFNKEITTESFLESAGYSMAHIVINFVDFSFGIIEDLFIKLFPTL